LTDYLDSPEAFNTDHRIIPGDFRICPALKLTEKLRRASAGRTATR
jgi:hypothetical protein